MLWRTEKQSAGAAYSGSDIAAARSIIITIIIIGGFCSCRLPHFEAVLSRQTTTATSDGHLTITLFYMTAARRTWPLAWIIVQSASRGKAITPSTSVPLSSALTPPLYGPAVRSGRQTRRAGVPRTQRNSRSPSSVSRVIFTGRRGIFPGHWISSYGTKWPILCWCATATRSRTPHWLYL